MEINHNTLSEFQQDFNAAIAEMQKKYGVKISLGPITYEENRFSAKLTVVNGKDAEEAERAAFDADVWKFSHLGLEKGMYKRVIIGTDGNRYAIVGFNTNAQKYPLILISIRDGTRIKAGELFIKEIVNEYYAQVFEQDD